MSVLQTQGFARCLRATLLLCAAWACGVAQAGWTALQSEHFIVYVESDGAAARQQLQSLELFHWLALRLLGSDERSVRVAARLPIVILPGRLALRHHIPGLSEYVEGVYTLCPEGTVAYAVEPGTAAEETVPWGQVVRQHETAHHLMFQYATTFYPSWYVEGFAEYLSTTWQRGQDLVVGDLNRWRASSLMKGNWLTVEQLLTWGRKDERGRPSSEQDYFYAQSWLLTHFMLSDDARAAALSRYFARLAQGADPVSAFEATTAIPVADLWPQLLTHLKQIRPLRVQGASLPQAQIRSQVLDPDQAAVLLDGLALRHCATGAPLQDIVQRLQTRIALPEAGDATRLALAHAQLLSGRPQVAEAVLEPLLSAKAPGPETHSLVGRSLAAQARDMAQTEQKNELLEAAASHLFKAYRDRKDHAPTLYHLAWVLSQLRGPTDLSTLNAARGARALMPGVPAFALQQARFEVRSGNIELAVRALQPLAADQHQPVLASRMREAIAGIRAGRGVAALEEAARNDSDKRKSGEQ